MNLLRPWLVFAAVVFAAVFVSRTARAADPIVRIGDVRSLSRDEAARSLPLRVRGVVTWRGLREQVIVQDETGGCWLEMSEARQGRVWTGDPAIFDTIRVGHVLEIEGVSGPGGFAPVILPATIRIVGQQSLPPARPMQPARFFSGADAGLRIEARAVVQGYRAAEGAWVLELNANPGRFTAEFSSAALPDPAALVDAEVSVTGVAVTRINSRGELTMPRLFSSRASDLVIDVPATPPFSAPLTGLDRLLPFRTEPIGPHRLRVIGVVTYALEGKFLYLQEGVSAVRIEVRSTENFSVGDRVEAAGFVDMTRAVGMLVEAQVRKIGTDVTPAAIAVNPETIIVRDTQAMNVGKRAQPHDFDGHLIRFQASLLTVQSDHDPKDPSRRLTLQRGEMILGAILPAGETRHLDQLRPGSQLEITGIVQLEYTTVAAPRLSLVPTRLDVILRSAEDVRVVRSPSWWTAERLLAAMAIVALAFGAALVWAWQLRLQVRRKTEQLAVEIHARRDAAVEFQATLRERNRLAANLHDTLLQTLGGIGFQIGAGEAEAALPERAGKPIAQLGVARRILDHAVQELRSSVWALRNPPLQGRSLPEVLRLIVEREGAGKAAHIDLSAKGDFSHVSEFVAGNLVLATQEALRNALKHGSPREIALDVKIADTADSISLVIRDDGAGFTPGKEAGANQGHFGLVGMRERIERLDGTLHVESAPGQGTTVRIEVPLRSYDETVA
ncbi:MAG: sensor histidine kinase [Opitutaceae bacterium]